ncbi:uncharacterized protein LOC114333130 [Diabrotica virgifera virgifera]|uniref:Uncharacterized protein n=1 Tax=Diabrotica virgifera virgifera TaxID=50390 RepID=A0ABM5IQD0_DIAVI|nr:uncharacterized protein LOC114333130 [Diabrotica virgifera virgifera]
MHCIKMKSIISVLLLVLCSTSIVFTYYVPPPMDYGLLRHSIPSYHHSTLSNYATRDGEAPLSDVFLYPPKVLLPSGPKPYGGWIGYHHMHSVPYKSKVINELPVELQGEPAKVKETNCVVKNGVTKCKNNLNLRQKHLLRSRECFVEDFVVTCIEV